MHSQSDVQREEHASVAVTAPPGLVRDNENILTVLSDDAARSLLCAADEPLTAKRLAEKCELPLSTVYRKLEQLANTPLMEETTRVRVHGKHPQQYQRRFESLQIHVPPHCSSGMDISLVPRATEEY